jgi:hypothetical protein
MIADPLCDVRLRAHHALTERAIPGELKIFFFAIGRVGYGADRQDDFNHSQYPLCKNETGKYYAEFVIPSRLPAWESQDFIALQRLS